MKELYESLLKDVSLPELYRAQYPIRHSEISDVAGALRRSFFAFDYSGKIRGKTVAIAVGSRGITNLPRIVTTLADCLKESGAKELFIVPAMGSHGGAVAEHQTEILKSLGISEETVGVGIRSSMETVLLGETEDGKPVYFDRNAASADYTVSICRIKPHNSFIGPFGSGMVKMNVIGLGKQRGASFCHSLGMENMGKNLVEFGKISLERSNLLFAVGLIENAIGETVHIEVVPKETIMDREPQLLKTAKEQAAHIPFRDLDVLIMDEMGKNIAGTGFDTLIIQRFSSDAMKGEPYIKRLVCLSLTPDSHGNAAGMGMVDVITKRFFDAIDLANTYPNFLTARTPNGCRIPMIMETDELAIRAALQMAPGCNLSDPRVVRIHNTKNVYDIRISRALIAEAREAGWIVEDDKNGFNSERQ